jgi:3-isopropylmalate/(R)-2-methylmalate dehydratase large subunit
MGMTISEKILARHAGMKTVKPGEFALARVDLTMANDITAPLSIKAFEEVGGRKVLDPGKITLVMDHFSPSRDIPSATQIQTSRRFAEEQGISLYFESDGIAHALLPERGMVLPGQLVLGADSHTCTYGALGAFATGVGSTDVAAAWMTGKMWLRVPETIKFIYDGQPKPWVSAKDYILHTIGDLGTDGATYHVMEFSGPAVGELTMAGRFTMCNMAVEAGAKAGIMEADEKTLAFLGAAVSHGIQPYGSDPDAEYLDVRHYDVSRIDPLVALPHSPAKVQSVRDIRDIWVDQVVIGSCTNGRLEDIQSAAKVLSGKKVSPHVRLIVLPATRRVYMASLRLGLIEQFVEAGGVFCPPTCGPCLGGHLGILAEGERCLSTTNRNFVGRMGHPNSEIYLANPSVAAATAVAGKITHPEAIM